MIRSIENYFVGWDIFGYKIGVHFKGKGSYQTRLGALLTLAVYVLMLANLFQLVTAFIDGSRQRVKTDVRFVDRSQKDAIMVKENLF